MSTPPTFLIGYGTLDLPYLYLASTAVGPQWKILPSFIFNARFTNVRTVSNMYMGPSFSFTFHYSTLSVFL